VCPDQLAGAAVERDHRAARAGGGVEHAADGERRPFQLELRARAEIIGLEAPRDLELVEVRRVDLIERRVFRAVYIRRVVRPVAVLRARDAGRLTGKLETRNKDKRDERQRRSQGRSCHRWFSGKGKGRKFARAQYMSIGRCFK
jgi:hypothetical protein